MAIEDFSRIEIEKTALLVIDMQRGFLDKGSVMEVPQGREIIPNIRRLVEASRKRDVSVIFTQFVYSPMRLKARLTIKEAVQCRTKRRY